MDKQRQTELVIKAQQGDSEALNELIGDCYQDIYYFAFKTVKNEDIAGDVTQESCIEIMTTLDKLREPAAFSVWARRITYHQCTRYFRESKNEVQFEENEDGETILDVLTDDSDDVMPEKVTEDKEFQQIMQDMLNSLPAEQRSALLLYYYEKMSVKEIAEIHGTTEGTVKSRLNYGRKAVKKKVEEYEEKSGTRLHSVAILPLLLRYLFEQGAAEIPQISAPVLPGIAGTAGAASAAGTASAASATGASAASSASAAGSALSAAGGVVVKKAAFSILIKIAATILAAAAAVGVIYGGAVLIQNRNTAETAATTTSEVNSSDATNAPGSTNAIGTSGIPGTSQVPDTSEPPAHTHAFTSEWVYDASSHWQICDCGENSETAAHSFENDLCTVCNSPRTSVGLEFTIGNYGYEDFQYAYAVTGIGTCTDKDIILPTMYNGLRVMDIYYPAFMNCTEITSVSIPDGFYLIGQDAFSGCTSLTNMTLPNGIFYISSYAFRGCSSLIEVTIPNSVNRIEEQAFSNCPSLRTIHYSGTMAKWEAIEKGLYWDEGERGYVIHCKDGDIYSANHQHESASQWGHDASQHWQICPCGEKFAYDLHTYVSGVCECGSKKVSEGFEFEEVEGGYTLFLVGECTDVDVVIPSEYNGRPVVEISMSAFQNCDQIMSIYIPDSVQKIGDTAFMGCTSLVSINIPEGITYIDSNTFAWCSSLTDITLPDSVTDIGMFAFQDCTSLKSINLSSVENIGYYAFAGCTSLELVDTSCSDIGASAFSGCTALTSATLRGECELSAGLFSGCTALTSVTLSAGNSYFDMFMLSNCTSLTDIHYLGTMAQWKAITKDEDWDADTPDYTVHCSDGDIAKGKS